MLESLQPILESWATAMPLGAFVAIGSVVEEVIAPIPSPFILTLAGSIAATRGDGWLDVVVLLLLATVGKTIGCWILYAIGDAAEDVLLARFGRYLGLSHQSVEWVGRHFRGGPRDLLVLTGLRALPIVPSAPLSLLCGVTKIPLRPYLIGTFFGSAVRCGLFLLLGYLGADAAFGLVSGVNSLESILTVVCALSVAAFIGWCYWRRQERRDNEKTPPASGGAKA